ncbi:MAG: T9SS type A sorting domain-containing protein [Vicingaceae bacterium]|nr:T9SS type A sorting domain-containing protein [Vicingaceae bacterium]
MKKLLFIILLFCFFNNASKSYAQGFVSVGLTMQIPNVGVYVDSVNNNLYVYGWMLDSVNTWQKIHMLRYNGIQWDTLRGFNGQVLDVEIYKDTLYACGVFTAVNGDTTIKYIAKYNGTNWESMGNFNQLVDRLKVTNDTLFALGWFQEIDGDSINSVAKWNGTQWVSLFDFPKMDSPPNMARDIEFYNNNYYVGGNFTDFGKGIRDLVVYKNGSWQKVGQGLVGGNTTVNVLQVYKNELYFSGMIDESAGNVGHTILKWNDTTLSKVGNGLQNGNNQNSGFPQAWDLTVYNGYLYASGTFSFANHIPAQGLARWDGTQWCGYATDTINPQITGKGVEFFQDTMYWATNIDTINGVFVNKLLKYTGGNTTAICSTIVGINKFQQTNSLTLYPNPTNNSITIKLKDEFYNKDISIEIYDIISQLSYSNIIKKHGNNHLTINVTHLPKGIYLIKLQMEGENYSAKFVKQ